MKNDKLVPGIILVTIGSYMRRRSTKLMCVNISCAFEQ